MLVFVSSLTPKLIYHLSHTKTERAKTLAGILFWSFGHLDMVIIVLIVWCIFFFEVGFFDVP